MARRLLNQLAHFEITTPKLEESATFFKEMMGMEEPLLNEQMPFPDDVYVERLYARNTALRRCELRGALCRYELPAVPPEAAPRLLLTVAGLEDAEQLCSAGAWVVLSSRCTAETWCVFAPPGHKVRRNLLDRC